MPRDDLWYILLAIHFSVFASLWLSGAFTHTIADIVAIIYGDVVTSYAAWLTHASRLTKLPWMWSYRLQDCLFLTLHVLYLSGAGSSWIYKLLHCTLFCWNGFLGHLLWTEFFYLVPATTLVNLKHYYTELSKFSITPCATRSIPPTKYLCL